MIKKQLGLLAGSIALAASANAAIVASGGVGSDSSAILVLSTLGQGAFVIDTGLFAGQLAAGNGFSVDVSAASAALGGSIDSFAILGVVGGTNASAYNSAVGYVDGDSGVVYSNDTAHGLSSVTTITNLRNAVNSYITFVSAGGFFADLTSGDLDSTALGTTLFGVGAFTSSSNIADLFAQTISNDGSAAEGGEVAILNPPGLGGVQLVGTDFSVSAVPVPAAAWLFGSALLGLGVVRRKA